MVTLLRAAVENSVRSNTKLCICYIRAVNLVPCGIGGGRWKVYTIRHGIGGVDMESVHNPTWDRRGRYGKCTQSDMG